MWDCGLQENLSHAGKIRLLQMTAYRALLLNTSFPQLALVTIARNEKERFTNLVCRCRQGRVEEPDLMRNWSFIHCVSRTAGDGITSTRQRGQSWSQSNHAHKQKLSARLSVRVGFTRRLCLSVILRPLSCHIFQQWPFAQTAIFYSHWYEMHWLNSLVKNQYS